MKYILPIITTHLLLIPHLSFAKEDPIAFECSSNYQYTTVKGSNMRGVGGFSPPFPLQRDTTEPDITPQIHRVFHLSGNQYVKNSVTMDDSKKSENKYDITLELTDILTQKTQSKTYTYTNDRPPNEEFEIKISLESLRYNISSATFRLKCSKVDHSSSVRDF